MALLIGLACWAVLELWVITLVATQIGAAWTVLALVACSVLGWVLIRREGRGAWRAIQEESAAGRSPDRVIVDAALVLIGGVLLIVPGFVSGLLGLLLLVPPIRSLVRPLAVAWTARRVARAAQVGTTRGRVRVVTFGTRTRPPGRSPWGDDVIEGEGEEVDLGFDRRRELP
ncbi:MAG TPA: FxsA family protein [Microthrixaceae bacterium]|nr:FxsA family protein [Microthrixaceae bacterium]